MKRLFMILLLATVLSVSALAILEQTEVIDTKTILNYFLPQEIKTQVDSLDHKNPLEAIALRAQQFEKQRDVSEE